jgi:hypothetical protein
MVFSPPNKGSSFVKMRNTYMVFHWLKTLTGKRGMPIPQNTNRVTTTLPPISFTTRFEYGSLKTVEIACNGERCPRPDNKEQMLSKDRAGIGGEIN